MFSVNGGQILLTAGNTGLLAVGIGRFIHAGGAWDD